MREEISCTADSGVVLVRSTIFQPPIHPNLLAVCLKMHDKTVFSGYWLFWEICIVIRTTLSIPDTQPKCSLWISIGAEWACIIPDI